MDEYHFLRPLFLWFAVPSLLVWLGLWRQQDNVGSWVQVIDKHLLEHLIVGESNRPPLRPIHLLFFLWVVTSIVLAGPTWETEPSPFSDDEAGLVVLLKVSGTMLATDVQPSRIDRAKLKLRDLLQAREGAATGLIVYSGSAHLVMPLTRDDRIISAMAEDLTPDLMAMRWRTLWVSLSRFWMTAVYPDPFWLSRTTYHLLRSGYSPTAGPRCPFSSCQSRHSAHILIAGSKMLPIASVHQSSSLP